MIFMEKKSNKKLVVILSCVLVVLIAASVTAYLVWKNNNGGSSAEKEITVCIDANGQKTTFEIETEAEFLRGALEQENLVKGDETEFGLFVTEVNGIKADSSQNQWWKFSKSGQDLMTGIDTTPIADGDTFEITLDTY